MWSLNVSLYVHFLSEVCLGEGRGERGVLLLFFLSRGGCGKVATNTETVF